MPSPTSTLVRVARRHAAGASSPRDRAGFVVNKKPVWKITRELGLRGLPGPRKSVKNLVNAPRVQRTSSRGTSSPRAPFSSCSPTSPSARPPTASCAPASCSTLYSRKLVGWAIDRRCEAALVNDAPRRRRRGPRRSRRSTPTAGARSGRVLVQREHLSTAKDPPDVYGLTGC